MTVDVRTWPDSSLRGPSAGILAQFGVLSVLAAGSGLHLAGWFAGAAYALVTGIMLARAMHRYGMRVLGPANAVTLVRGTLVGGVTALVADSLVRPIPLSVLVVLVSLATIALILDAVDGQVARRTGTTTPLGARFDGEIDAFLILVLSVFAAGSLGPWVLAIGAFRYVFVVAGWYLPWLQGPLEPSYARKTVAALQGIVLVVASAQFVPIPLMGAVVGAALGLLCWSFGRDIRSLWLAGRMLPVS